MFGHDVFVSFPLGGEGRDARRYAADLARRLREHDLTVFFSEDDLAPGEELDATLRATLRRARILVVVVNRETLRSPRWVKLEVEEFRRVAAGRPIVSICLDGGLRDPALAAEAGWLGAGDRVWIDEDGAAGGLGVVSEATVTRLLQTPLSIRVGVRWRWTVRGAFALLAALTCASGLLAWSATRNAAEARAQRAAADRRAKSLASAEMVRHALGDEEMAPDLKLLLSAEAAVLRGDASSAGALLSTLRSTEPLYRILRLPGPPPATDDARPRFRGLAFDASGERLAAITETNWLLWDVPRGRLVASGGLAMPERTQEPASATREAAIFLARNGTVLLHAGPGAPLLRVDPDHPDSVHALAAGRLRKVLYSGPDDRLATVELDGTVSLWDASTGQLIARSSARIAEEALLWIERGRVHVSSEEGCGEIPFEPGPGAKLARCPAEVRPSAWEGRRPSWLPREIAAQIGLEAVAQLVADPGSDRRWQSAGVLSMAVSPEGDALLVGERNGTVCLGTREGQELMRRRNAQYDGLTGEELRAVLAVAFAPGPTLFAAGFLDGEIWVWWLDDPAGLGHEPLAAAPRSLCPAEGGGFTASVNDRRVRIEVRGGAATAGAPEVGDCDDERPADLPGRVYSVRGHARPGAVRVAERLRRGANGELISNDRGDPDGSRVFLLSSAAAPKAVEVSWRGAPLVAAVATDASAAAVGFENGSLVLIDVARGEVATGNPISGQYADTFTQVADAVVLPGGSAVYWVNQSSTLYRWSRSSGALAQRDFGTPLHALALSGDGTVLLVGDDDGAVRLVDPTTLNASDPLPLFPNTAEPAVDVLLADGTMAAAQTADGRIAVLDVSVDAARRIACARAGRELEAVELDPYVQGLELEPLCAEAASDVRQLDARP